MFPSTTVRMDTIQMEHVKHVPSYDVLRPKKYLLYLSKISFVGSYHAEIR
jgi:hypothetical protein